MESDLLLSERLDLDTLIKNAGYETLVKNS
jgi:hypothetical protein